MNIAQSIEQYVESMPAGQIFGYQSLPRYVQSPSAVIKAVGRLVNAKRIKRLSKGKFYVPKEGILGAMKPSDAALLRSVLHKGDRLRGYVTGMSLYNQLGLTTQVPRTIVIACNGGSQTKDFGTIRIKIISSRLPIQRSNVKLLQYLDALKDIKKISDSDINLSLKIMQRKISALSAFEQEQLVDLAEDYYSPQVRALTGLLMMSIDATIAERLKNTLNPTTVFKLKLNPSIWPQARQWNIR